MHVEVKSEVVPDTAVMMVEKTYRCPKGHEWTGPFAGLRVTGTRDYGPICPDCYGLFLEGMFGGVQEVLGPTGADAAGAVPVASNR